LRGISLGSEQVMKREPWSRQLIRKTILH